MTATSLLLEPGVGALSIDGRGLLLRLEHSLRAPLDDVWKVLTASPHREHWIACASVGELRAAATVQPPFWPTALDTRTVDVSVSGVTREWQPPSVFKWTAEEGHVTWELGHLHDATTVVAELRIDDDDRDVAAQRCADFQVGFAQLIRVCNSQPVLTPTCATYLALAAHHRSALAAP